MINIVRYEIDNKLGIKIALVADLHEKNPVEVLDALSKISPDYIMFPGDLWERQDESESGEWNHANMSFIQTENIFLRGCYFFTQLLSGHFLRKIDNRTKEEKNYSYFFLQEASKIAPIFLSVGNHEWYYTQKDYEVIKETGTILLDNKELTLCIKNKMVLVGGLSTRADLEWLKQYCLKTADYKILLCHHPEYVKRYVEKLGKADVILSGHAHGGQWRIFGKIPVYAPGQGLLPKYTRGIYITKAGKMVVTSGCANHINYPRLGNPCEVVEILL